MKELIERGEFKALLPKVNNLEERLTRLINQEKIMLFLKGSPDDVKCGFSKAIVEILNSKRYRIGILECSFRAFSICFKVVIYNEMDIYYATICLPQSFMSCTNMLPAQISHSNML